MKNLHYFAYGMNTNLDSMSSRCRDARPLGYASLPNYEFRFANHADVVPKKGSRVDGVLWTISTYDLRSLDILEGHPSYYNRLSLPIMFEGKKINAITYFMQPGFPDQLPSSGYWDMVLSGYNENGVPTGQLREAYNRILDQKSKEQYNGLYFNKELDYGQF